jgi:hypothetical protein
MVPALWDQLAGKHVEVYQEPLFSGLFGEEEMAGGCSADVRRRLCWVPLLVEGAGLSTIMCSGPEAAVVPAGGCCNVVSGRPCAAGATPVVVVRVPAAGVFPLNVECPRLAREFLDASQKLVTVRRLAHSRECGRGNSLCDAVCTVGRGIQLNLWMAGNSGLYSGG